MNFKFKIQQYQTDAVEHTVNVFTGQPSKKNAAYRRDVGRRENGTIPYQEEYIGFRNAEVELTDRQLLENIHKMQIAGDIPLSNHLIKSDGLGACSLDIEMETGTGKTYVYIKTMFELNKHYGWSKFIVVVPSIAIREGVFKSFAILEDHFMESYGKKARYFIYDSSNLAQIDSYSSDASINVMIINSQAFARDLKEGTNNKVSLVMYSKRDNFQSRRPIDVIAANRPIVIIDEPQKIMKNEKTVTEQSLKKFHPLFILNYSATHEKRHNLIYALDALDAYKQRLVKKIQVKGITIHNLLGTQSYIYFDSIILSKNRAPEVRLEIEVKGKHSTKRQLYKFSQGDSLYDKSNLPVYKGFTITEINPLTNTIHFLNGDKMQRGEVAGDVSESTIQQIQIRETIKSHFEKERLLFNQGIKTLSLFFIDEVANYKGYDDSGEIVQGPLWNIFEKEYMNYINENIELFEDDYQRYLRRFTVGQVHNGYFSIDKRSGRSINSEVKRGESISTDISAYDLILKNKERLLSFEEPTRFIFSHSALREGWDNPNVFQICTLRHANSTTAKRQEVGRGLRICVDQLGNRMDAERLGDAVHDINKLTVIANESYSSFVDSLQNETREALRERPTQASVNYFEGISFRIDNELHTINSQEAASIVSYLFDNDYIDERGNIQQTYHADLKSNSLAPMSRKLQSIEEQIHRLIQSIFDPSALNGMIEDANEKAEVINEKLNDNAKRDEFKALWNEINHHYVYTVHYDSEELIKKVIDEIDTKLNVAQLKYIVTTGQQGDNDLDFIGQQSTRTRQMSEVSNSNVPYDLVGDIAKGATLTRRTVVRILKGIMPAKLLYFKNNPEEFIRNVIKIIKEQKSTMIVEHICYNRTDQTYDIDIFTKEKKRQPIDMAYAAHKHILDYVFSDSKGERKFAEDLDKADEVCVYAKLPRRTFHIPTPVGDYAPDWAIAFNDNMGIKHIFFIAETKGSMDSMQLKTIETAKIECAKKLFNNISTNKVRYHEVKDYQTMIDIIQGMI